ncbi:NACHT domain-containing protein [Pseudoalteromonas rubra]|uniref:NACHT domain-containing protein n=1 Tax=Pseudoalteromonas rubra TaxID=43658 RepID=A0A5S3X4P5_9GAMM|nr:NACHT domain-containing protein [Pseudoalteromonas rubra]TMP39557.1 hypothetical protein CWB98_02920 [Pseudoalteromonas rubra]
MLLETIASKSLVALSSAIAKKFVEKSWNKLEKEFSTAFSEEKIKDFCASCQEYVNLRTIYSAESDVFIDDVYVPLFVSPVGDEKTKFEVVDTNFYSEGVINIQGVAGQGKSTFMRKMLLNTVKGSEQIPVFYELKYFEDKPLVDIFIDWFDRHGISLNERVLRNLLKENKIKVLLDGFDEIEPSLQPNAARRIKEFSKEFNKLTVIVSSRPYTAITREASISNYKILDFEMDDIEKLLLKISDSDINRVEEAMEQIKKYPRIKKVINTPILAILLFLTYRFWSKIPDNLADFYKKIFITLLTHHDSVKSGKKIERGIKIPLNDYDIEDVFSVFCFKTFVSGKLEMSSREANVFMSSALEYYSHDRSLSECMIEVVKRNTGILCSDGYDTLAFTHKSLQEYYTAYFISKENDRSRIGFYKKMQSSDDEIMYRDILAFLSGIDTVFYANHYYIPVFKKHFSVSNVRENIRTIDTSSGLEKIYSSIFFVFSMDNSSLGFALEKCVCDIKGDCSKLLYVNMMPWVVILFSTGVFKNIEDMFSLGEEVESGTYKVPLTRLLDSIGHKKSSEIKDRLKELYISSIEEQHRELITQARNRKKSLLEDVFSEDGIQIS